MEKEKKKMSESKEDKASEECHRIPIIKIILILELVIPIKKSAYMSNEHLNFKI